MRLLDEKGRLFGLINIVDLTILILAAALIFGLYNKFQTMAKPQNQPVIVQVLCRGVHPDIAGQVAPGDKMIANGSFVPLELKSVSAAPARITYSVPKGGPELVSGVDPGLRDLTITLQGVATSLTADLTLYGQEIKAGRSFVIRSQTYQLEGTITAVTLVNSH